MTDVPQYVNLGFTDAEWGLLVGLPQSVVIAASAASPDSQRKTRAEAAAGLDIISDARASASPLVAEVAAQIVSSVGDPGHGAPDQGAPDLGAESLVIEPDDPTGYAKDVLERAAQARALLAAKVAPADAETYQHWLVEIAEGVVGAASSGGVLGLGGETVTETEREFRDDLAQALAD